MDKYKIRRSIILLLSFSAIFFVIFKNIPIQNSSNQSVKSSTIKIANTNINSDNAKVFLNKLIVKDRASSTGYSREQFGAEWTTTSGCDTRNIILNRDLSDVVIDENCFVISGILNDPYTGKTINFKRGSGTSSLIQIDHVVALSNAWQTGAQQFTLAKRIELANDPLELLAVDGSANQQKSDGDAATWLPSNKTFRCQYVARQIAVKIKYLLWVTKSEHDAIQNILINCPNQMLPSI